MAIVNHAGKIACKNTGSDSSAKALEISKVANNSWCLCKIGYKVSAFIKL